jgi:chemotaxis protein histidine kinase CheA
MSRASVGETPVDAAAATMMLPDEADGTAIIADPTVDSGWSTTILTLPTERAEQLQFAVADMRPLAEQIEPAAEMCHDVLGRSEGSEQLRSTAARLRSAAGDFRFATLDTLTELLDLIAGAIADSSEEILHELVVRARAIHQLADQFLGGLSVGLETCWPLETFSARVQALIAGQTPPTETSLWHGRDPARVLELDLVMDGVEVPPPWTLAPPDPDATADEHTAATPRAAVEVDRQVRVNVNILERLADLAGQLVLCKNRLFGITREAAAQISDRALLDQLTGVAHEFEQLTTGLQTDVLRTRTVPMAMLFDRYGRVVRDVARINEREVALEVTGREVEIDRDVIEILGEPLSQIVRFAARCMEPEEDRRAAGKPTVARMGLSAEAEEGRIVIRLEVDGDLPDLDEIRQIATTFGLMDEDDLEDLDEDELLMLLAEDDFPGSDLSGVLDLLEASRSRLRIRPAAGGFFCELTVPVRSTSVRAILCRVGEHTYAVPVRSVLEIMHPDARTLVHASQSRMLRRRNGLLPLIAASELLDERRPTDRWTALVVRGADQEFALMVDEVLGQEEVVIKSLGDGRAFGPISGATIREDGRVSLILDVEAIEQAAGEADTRMRLAA